MDNLDLLTRLTPRHKIDDGLLHRMSLEESPQVLIHLIRSRVDQIGSSVCLTHNALSKAVNVGHHNTIPEYDHPVLPDSEISISVLNS